MELSQINNITLTILQMVEPISTALAGLALVKKSVEFIKSNISTAKDIGDIINHVDAAMNGEQQLIKERDRKANRWTQEQMDKINEPQ